MASFADHSSSPPDLSSAPPVYQRKRISQRYSSSSASSYSTYSSALAASYQQQQQQQQQHTRHNGGHHYQHHLSARPLGQSSYGTLIDPSFDLHSFDHAENKYRSMNSNSKSNSNNGNNKNRSNMCAASRVSSKRLPFTSSSSSSSFNRLNAPPSPCLGALDSECRPTLISHDSSSALPSPSLSASSTDSIFSSASSTSMAHCSPILPSTTISALLLHDVPLSESSSVASSPVLSYCSSPRSPSSPISSPSSSPSPSPPPTNCMVGRTRRTGSTGSRTSQTSESSQSSGRPSQRGSHRSSASYSSLSGTSTIASTSAAQSKRRSMGMYSSSPLSRPLSIHSRPLSSKRSLSSSSFLSAAGATRPTSTAAAIDAYNSPQAIMQSSTRYIGFLLLPLIPLLFFALHAQTSTNFDTPAKYGV